MSTKNDGGPAFPSQQGLMPDGDWNPRYEQGMCLRDWFAGMALQGFMANKNKSVYFQPEDDAKYAYEIADAMLREKYY